MLCKVLQGVLDSTLYIKLLELKPALLSDEDFLTRESSLLATQFQIPIHTIENLKTRVAQLLLFPEHHNIGNSEEVHGWRQFNSALPSPQDIDSHKIRSHLPTGLSELNPLLGGGWPRGEMICLVGETQCGKTQVSLHSAVANAIQGNQVLIINTNNHLPLRRLHALASYSLLEWQLDHPDTSPEARNDILLAAFERIQVQHTYDLFDFLDLLCRIHDGKEHYDLIIIDCLHHMFAPYLSESIYANEKFAASTGTFNGITNLHPLIAQCLVLLRALCNRHVSGTTVLATNVGTLASSVGVKRMAMSDLSRVHPTMVMTGGSAVYMDTFDSALFLSPTNGHVGSSNKEETMIRADVIWRPPFYRVCSEHAIIRFPKLA